MESILEKIIAAKKIKIEAKAALGIYKVAEKEAGEYPHATVSLRDALKKSDIGIIAEFKRRSPSKREIHPYASPAVIIPEYQEAGATGCSVLTDTVYFGGSLSDLAIARYSSTLPLLRKDFIIDSRQLFEARLYGADAILLIASTLTKEEISSLTATAHSIGIEVLLEIHNEKEIEKIVPEVDIVGVNNRNLSNFETSLEASGRMAALIPEGMVKISESGISTTEDVRELRALGFDGFLMGETFMKRANPGITLRHFINELRGEK